MRRHKTDSNDTLTGRQRLELYRKLFMEARPIWKWLALSCLLCMGGGSHRVFGGVGGPDLAAAPNPVEGASPPGG